MESKFFFRPGRLQGHAELPARDLLLERLDVRVLLEKKIGDAGNDAGFVTAYDGDGGILFHAEIILSRRLQFLAHGFRYFVRRAGAFCRIAPAQLRRVSVL